MAGQEVFTEGLLFKRQRGRRSSDLQKLKFQERSCRLTASSFEYYKGRKLRGQFPLTRVRIVEQVLQEHSHRKYCFQIGDNEEVMYLAAKSNEKRTTWMQAFRKVAKSRGNDMLEQYHPGVYGSPVKNEWSCCRGSQRTCKGCQSIHQSLSKTWTYPRQQPRSPKAKRTRAWSAEISPSDFPEARKTTMAATHSLQPVPEIDVIVTPAEDNHECVPRRTTRGRANTQDSGLGSSITGSKNTEDFYLDSEDEASDDEQFPYSYNILPSSHSRAVTALAFYGSDLLSGSRDRHVLQWDTSYSMVLKAVKVSDSVLALDVWSHFLAIGSTTIQLVDMCSKKLKRIMLVDMDSSDEEDPLKKAVLNLVAYVGAEGMLATASFTSNVVKLWEPLSTDEGIIQSPRHRIPLGEPEECKIWSLSASRNPGSPWVAVGVRLERQHKPVEKKLVHLIDWKSQKCCYSIPAGYGTIHTAFLPDGKHLAIGCSASVDVYDTMSGNRLYNCTTDGTISSLFCYLPQTCGNLKPHVAVGLTTGEVQVFEDAIRMSSTLPKPEIQSAATAIAYSEDIESLVVGYKNGKIHLWKAQDPLNCRAMQKGLEPVNLLERKFRPDTIFTRMEQQTFGYEGGKYISEVDKYELIIPEGAIPKSTRITVEFGVSPYGPFGPFEYPHGCQPVSAIVWLCANPAIKFLKPVEIKLPHFANFRDKNSCKALTFLKADHNQKSNEMFHFSETEGESSFTLDPDDQISYGRLHTNHFCMYCVGEYNRSDTDSANYSLVIARPKHISQDRPSQIHCCLTYLLPTCIKLISEQLSESQYHIDKKIMRFADANQHALRISLTKDDVEAKGWLVSLVSDEEIDTRDVCFWDGFKSCPALIFACKECMYPPRFTVEVSGRNATKSGNLKISFEGGTKVMGTEIPLELQEPTSERTNGTNSELVVGNSLNQPIDHVVGGNPTYLSPPSPVPLPPAIQPFK